MAAAELRELAEAFPEEWREPALGWAAVQAWEDDQGVVLPEPYRTFVAEIAAGSSQGPPEDGGLLPLGWLPADWPEEMKERDLLAPFPLAEAWTWEEDPGPADTTAPLINAIYQHGSVVLGGEDGPMYWLLVVTGPQRARIWLLSEIGASPYPGSADQDADGIGFLEWIRRWQSGLGWFD
ncbi:hypothetical protein NE236_07910 [Actinoallomurus purpureus]|uniref:hypothetical protein n=1 Tax=Actinoallomurus purpureus TaxID=478114 RepID=UPI002091EC4E|nr:hypothetical protein [Actinoallomurus purpureus]MCO6004903.1 hypothetical protein [Actinoallomurus purpureus]